MHILEVTGLKKVYTTRFGGQEVEALKNVNFSVEQGEYVAIMGESGSGKTTLLNILAALDRPTAGSVVLDGMELAKLKESQVAAFRRDNLGFVFQEFNLLDTFTIEDNIYLPLVLAGMPHARMRERLAPLAQRLGITELLKSTPTRFPAARSSGPLWPEPSSRSPSSCWPTSPRGRWTPGPPTSCCGCSAISTGRARPFSWSPTPSRRPAPRNGCCSSGTERSSTSSTGGRTRISSSTSGSRIR